MTEPWGVSVSIDARGAQDAQVRIRPSGPDRMPQVNVRVGSLLAHCLDPSAVMSIASAWAAGQVRVGTWLPVTAPPPPAAARGFGVAYPASSVIFEGRQPWTISTVNPGLTVTFGCVAITVHDRAALETQTRAWAEASAISARLFPGRAVPFRRLLERAQVSSIQRAAGEHERSQRRDTGRDRG